MVRGRRASHVAATLATGVVLAVVGILAMPALPRLVPGPVAVRAAQIPAVLDHVTTTDVALPFAASDVSLHWHGNPTATVSIRLATEPGQWGEAIPVEVDEAGLGGAGRDGDPDPAPGDAESYGAVIWSAGARYVRVNADRPLGKVTVVGFKSDGPPRMVIASGTDPDVGTADANVANAAVDAPSIVTRAQWGADESYRFDYAGHEKWPPSYYPLQVFIVHHTAGRNNDPNPAATLRAIYYDDAILRGWGDFGYNFAIDSAGRIYEGRHARNYASGELHDGEDHAGNVARGAHAKGYNSGTLGIVLLGTFDTVLPTTAARASLEKLLAWESARHGINPTGSTTYVNPDLGTTKLLNNISGHRNVNATDCPGSMFYSTFPTLRSHVASRIAATLGSADTTPPTVHSFVSMAPDPTGGSSIDFGLVFSEPVTGLTIGDFVVGGTSTGWSVTGVKGIGSGYTVTVGWTPSGSAPTGPPEGSIELGLKANAVTDGGSHTGPASPASATANFAPDTTAPTVALTYTPSGGATNADQIDVTVTFSEPVAPLTTAGIEVGGTSEAAKPWTLDPVVGSGAHYAFTLEKALPANGTLTIDIPAGATTDAAGNPNEASTVHTVIIDRAAPTTSPPAAKLRAETTLSTTLPINLTWSGSDGSIGSGIKTYDVARSVDGGSFAIAKTGLTSAAWATTLTSGHSYRFEVRAHDKAGNVGTWVAGVTLKPSLLQQSSSSIVYHGTWTTSSSSVYSGSSDRYATAGGASASLTTSARGFAFVTSRGPTRGSVQVYLDGVLKATIDLNAPTVQYRYVAYAISFGSVGTHTIRVVVAGSGRVDLDAFEVLR